jgi:exodeoxyribonuclease VII large subunit
MPPANGIPQVISVTALNRLVRSTLEGRFSLLCVVGEISNLSRASSGHFYFTLKDDAAQVRAVMFRSRAQLLPWRPENGQQVEAQALVTLYEARGDYQLSIEALRRTGIGRLYEAYARLREKLDGEGLFNGARKRPLPRFPARIGLVTSAQGAVLHDVLTTLARRAPHLPVTIFPTLVQGEAAPAQIAAAIAAAGADDSIALVIVARGGGSFEDLWAFNDETVARAIAACRHPVVSGVGHETDLCIADFVADARAATPTAAAELASGGWFAARDELAALGAALRRQAGRAIDSRMQRLDWLARRLLHPGERLARRRQVVDHLATRLGAAMARRIQAQATSLSSLRLRLAGRRVDTAVAAGRLSLLEQRLAAAMRSRIGQYRRDIESRADGLKHLNPEGTLARGYAIVRDAAGQIVRGSRQLRPADLVALQFADGGARARILAGGDPAQDPS